MRRRHRTAIMLAALALLAPLAFLGCGDDGGSPTSPNDFLFRPSITVEQRGPADGGFATVVVKCRPLTEDACVDDGDAEGLCVYTVLVDGAVAGTTEAGTLVLEDVAVDPSAYGFQCRHPQGSSETIFKVIR